MSNLCFFKACFDKELQATFKIINALPKNNLLYTPHPINRTAYEIAEHIVAHVHDFAVILQNNAFNQKLSFPFSSPQELAKKMKALWLNTSYILETYQENQWDSENITLSIGGKRVTEKKRDQMMWFFLKDIIHHRGQLSSYIRPMGGINPTIYGWSADTIEP